MTLHIKTLRTTEQFYHLEEQWKCFERTINHTHITASFDFLKTWWEVFKDVDNNEVGFNKKLLILLLYNDDNLTAIMPLVTLNRKKYFLTLSYIEFLAQQWGATSLDIIGQHLSNRELSFLFDWLYNNVTFDIVQLKYISENSPLFKKHEPPLIHLSGCPEFNLHLYKNYEDYRQKTYSKNLRQNIRTAHNNIQSQGITYSEEYCTYSEDVLKDIKRISKSKILDNKQSIYLNKNKHRFILMIMENIHSEVLFINLNGQRAAYRLNIIFNKKKYCIDASYDREYKKFQIGSLSIDFSIRDSFNKKLSLHSEGTGAEFYKIKFIKNVSHIYTLLKKGNTLFSYLLIFIIKRKLKGN